MEILIVIGQSLAIYAFLVIALSRVGPVIMAGLTPFEYLVVALLGSAVETGLYHGSEALSAGLASAATLILADRALSAAMCRWPRLRRLLITAPVVLVQHGRLIPEQLRRVRMTEDDVRTAVRRRGYDDLSTIRLAVLESSGQVAVVPK